MSCLPFGSLNEFGHFRKGHILDTKEDVCGIKIIYTYLHTYICVYIHVLCMFMCIHIGTYIHKYIVDIYCFWFYLPHLPEYYIFKRREGGSVGREARENGGSPPLRHIGMYAYIFVN